MTHLGVSFEEEMVYRSLLRHPERSAADLVADLPIIGDEGLDVVLDRLIRRGMVRIDTEDHLAAVEPEHVIDRMITSRLKTLQEQLQEVLSSRYLIDDLQADQQEGHGQRTQEEITRIEGLDQVRARIDDLTFFTHREILCTQSAAALSEEAISAARSVDLRSLRRGIAMRTLVRPETLDDPLTSTYLRSVISAGANIRVVPGPLERILVFDQRIALVPFDAKASVRGALLIRQPVLISYLLGYFEWLWESATEFDGEADAEKDDNTLSRAEQAVLRLMANVDKDETGARELGVSARLN